MPASRVTLADVARRAGVSRTTASFVMSDRTDMRISDEARQRVLAVAEELGYRPNLTARGLRTTVTRTIGLISDTIATTQFAGEVIHGALDTALAHDHLLFVVETSDDPAVEQRLIEGMLDRQVDALVYATMYTRVATPPPALDGRRVVLLNSLDETFDGPRVLPDELAGGRNAAAALVRAGHTDGIYSIGGRHLIPATPDGAWAGRLRMQGAEEVLAEAGLELSGTVECAWEAADGYAAVSGLLETGIRPRALICLTDRLTLGVYQALQQAGLRIPEDVSVVSFDDSALASWLRPGLTSVALPHYELGKAAVDLLLNGDQSRAVHRIDMPIRTRQSVAPPAADRS
ncbi:LacI family DNA-binding transcriptional regulator [Streptomyces enissocaesilis]|uniref:LacI family DNA-binding transcriptional regulator n=1 Tax=Streptomyces enissocaesilis TaxID=332589 RepID=A0ABP6K8A8_9ACTN